MGMRSESWWLLGGNLLTLLSTALGVFPYSQVEQTNQILEQYLCVYCNYQQDNWLELLPLAEFAYNNAPSTTTSVSPFFANKGYHLNLSVYPEWDIASSCVYDFVLNLDKLQDMLKEEIAKAQRQYQPSADSRC